MRWSDLNYEQQVLLAAWFALAEEPDALPYHEPKPVEFKSPLRHLAKLAGRDVNRWSSRRKEKDTTPSNLVRKPRVRVQRYQLAS